MTTAAIIQDNSVDVMTKLDLQTVEFLEQFVRGEQTRAVFSQAASHHCHHFLVNVGRSFFTWSERELVGMFVFFQASCPVSQPSVSKPSQTLKSLTKA